ncbi:MAG: 3-phosphoserine/phosphohydroxythreonine transaminase [Gammaproteobacteria bacterium]
MADRRFANRAWNFSAGPSALADPVIERAQAELPNWRGTGLSVMEMSHRSAEFIGIAEQAEADLRALMTVPDDYAVLFLQGGATLQFAMAPLNLLRDKSGADYFRTGLWSEKAVAEAQRLCEVNLAVDTKADGYRGLPAPAEWRLAPEAAFVHYTSNETIHGVQFHEVPDTHGVPLVCDMSSDILSREVDVSRFALIYAGAQKNLGPAGVAIAVIRRNLLGGASPTTPSMLDYAVHEKSGSMYNTPPTLAWYFAGLTLDWLKQEGGVQTMAERSQRKAAHLYDAIDGSTLYSNPVARESRSLMNVPFFLADPELDARFVEESTAAGLLNLAGHRATGGMRASLYNAMPEAGVTALVEFMREFERRA